MYSVKFLFTVPFYCHFRICFKKRADDILTYGENIKICPLFLKFLRGFRGAFFKKLPFRSPYSSSVTYAILTSGPST